MAEEINLGQMREKVKSEKMITDKNTSYKNKKTISVRMRTERDNKSNERRRNKLDDSMAERLVRI